MTAAALGTRLTIKTLDSEEIVDVNAGHPAGLDGAAARPAASRTCAAPAAATCSCTSTCVRRRSSTPSRSGCCATSPRPGARRSPSCPSRAASSPGCVTRSTGTREPAALPGRRSCRPATRSTLDGPEGHHAADVQRLRVGERLLLGDGVGGTAHRRGRGRRQGHARHCRDRAAVVRRAAGPAPRRGPGHRQGRPGRAGRPGDDRGRGRRDRAVGGVAVRGRSGGASAARKARDKWAATAREAAKQARRAVAAGGGAGRGVDRRAGPSTGRGDVRAARGGVRPRCPRWSCRRPATSCWSSARRAASPTTSWPTFDAAGAMPVRLGESVLRTSTAGVAAICVLSVRLGRW